MFRVAIICGGPSQERGISLNSARSVMDHLSCDNIEILPIYLNPNQEFFKISKTQLYSNTPADFDFKLSQVAHHLAHEDLAELLSCVDLVFPIVHGRFGEDGQLQSLLESLHIPFVGSSSSACKRFFHKYEASQYLKEQGFETLQSYSFSQSNPTWEADLQQAWQTHDFSKAIVKPVRGGSSIGVSSVNSPDEAIEKIRALFESNLDSEAMLEPFCSGSEFTITLIQNLSGQPIAMLPTEVECSYHGKEIFNYRKKYLPTNDTRYHTPPRFDETTIHNIQTQAEAIFKLFEMRDFARLDGWVLTDGRIVFTDFNPISGLEQNSFLFRQTSLIGLSHRATLECILKSAASRYNKDFYCQSTLAQDKTEVSVLFGGSTAERQVSLMSGTNVWLKLLHSKHYKPTPYLLDKQGNIWALPYSYALNHTVEEIYDNCVDAYYEHNRVLALTQNVLDRMDHAVSHVEEPPPERMSKETFASRVRNNNGYVFIALHGGEGEDGRFQAFLDQQGIPYNGAGSVASAICMDKVKTGEFVNAIKHPKVSSLGKYPISIKRLLNEDFAKKVWSHCSKEFHCQSLVIKPQREGCSAGIVHLKAYEELILYAELITDNHSVIPQNTFSSQPQAIEIAQDSGDDYFLEPFIQTDTIHIHGKDLIHTSITGWIEMTVGVLLVGDQPHALNPSITVSEGQVLSLEEKFQGGTGINITPPSESIVLDTTPIKHAIQDVAQALNLKDYARIDLFYNVITEDIVIIEVNTLPALTPSTVLFHQALTESPPIYPHQLLQSFVDAQMSRLCIS